MTRTNAKKIEKTTLATRMGTSWRHSFFGSLAEMIVGHKEISNLLGIAISTQWSAHRASKLGPRTVRVVTGETWATFICLITRRSIGRRIGRAIYIAGSKNVSIVLRTMGEYEP